MFCSLWLLLSWVIALLTALMEGEVGITHTYKAKHIFNSSATPRLETLTQTSLWNLIQLRPRPAVGSHKCARFCRQQIDWWGNSVPEGINCTPLASQKPRKEDSIHSNLTSTSPAPEDHRVKVLGHSWCRKILVINRQVPLSFSQKQDLPGAREKSLAINVDTLVHQSPLKKLSATPQPFTV